MNKNQNRLKLVQPQLNPQRFYDSYLKCLAHSDLNMNDKNDS